jgi:hypothetical protein
MVGPPRLAQILGTEYTSRQPKSENWDMAEISLRWKYMLPWRSRDVPNNNLSNTGNLVFRSHQKFAFENHLS